MTAMQLCRVFSLEPLVSKGIFGLRDYPKPLTPDQEAIYKTSYDFDTLAYDSFFDFRSGQLSLVCPKLFNFNSLVKGSCIAIDGVFQPFRVNRYARYDVLVSEVGSLPKEVKVAIEGNSIKSGVNLIDLSFFSGFNVLVTLSKNNHLVWVKDWAQHHVDTQGADAVLFIDNGSSAYKIEEIVDALSSVKGLKRIGVMSAPFKFGPVGSGAGKGGAKARFLQPALLNLVRLRLLQDARAVLLVDVDELVYCLGAKSIFDVTVSSPFKYVSIQGRWFDTEPHLANCARHTDHTIPRLDVGRCPPKYCIVPKSFFGKMSWSVHKLETDFIKFFPTSKSFYFSHLIRITDNWKGRLNMR